MSTRVEEKGECVKFYEPTRRIAMNIPSHRTLWPGKAISQCRIRSLVICFRRQIANVSLVDVSLQINAQMHVDSNNKNNLDFCGFQPRFSDFGFQITANRGFLELRLSAMLTDRR